MKQIKFRGLYEGQWVYGSYHYSADGKHHYILASEKLLSHDGGYMSLHSKEVWEVDGKTVCQFTGLSDKLGKDIYDGDIVDKKFKWVVCFSDGAFYVKNEYAIAYLLSEVIRKRRVAGCPIEVIGNIYENPELLNNGK
jgi:uncharacterized phage protein (TIGR01671 family)